MGAHGSGRSAKEGFHVIRIDHAIPVAQLIDAKIETIKGQNTDVRGMQSFWGSAVIGEGLHRQSAEVHGSDLGGFSELSHQVAHGQPLVCGRKALDHLQRRLLAPPLSCDLPEVAGICSGPGCKGDPFVGRHLVVEFGKSHERYLSAQLSSVQLLSSGAPVYPAAAVKTVHESRRARLEQLIKQLGTAKAVADATGIPAPQISQVINGYALPSGKLKTLGDDLARQADARLGKPAGWMDSDPDFEAARWPFSTLTPAQLAAIDNPKALEFAERTLLSYVPPHMLGPGQTSAGSPIEPATNANGPQADIGSSQQGGQWNRTQEGRDRDARERAARKAPQSGLRGGKRS